MLTGIFLLSIVFTDMNRNPRFNQYGPVEFSTYQDCMNAGETLATWMKYGTSYTITCTSKETGEDRAIWGHQKN